MGEKIGKRLVEETGRPRILPKTLPRLVPVEQPVKEPVTVPAQMMLAMEDVYADPPRLSMRSFIETFILEKGESLDDYMEALVKDLLLEIE